MRLRRRSPRSVFSCRYLHVHWTIHRQTFKRMRRHAGREHNVQAPVSRVHARCNVISAETVTCLTHVLTVFGYEKISGDRHDRKCVNPRLTFAVGPGQEQVYTLNVNVMRDVSEKRSNRLAVMFYRLSQIRRVRLNVGCAKPLPSTGRNVTFRLFLERRFINFGFTALLYFTVRTGKRNPISRCIT